MSDIIDEIKKLKQGERYIVPEGDYGKAEVWKIHDLYILFEIPAYGGQPMFYRAYHPSELQTMIDTIESFT